MFVVAKGAPWRAPTEGCQSEHPSGFIGCSVVEGTHENNLAEKSDVVTKLQDVCVLVTNGHIGHDAGENVTN